MLPTPTNLRITKTGLTPTPPPSVPTGVLSSSAITYLGAMRMPYGLNTIYAKPGLTGRLVNGVVHLFVHKVNTGDPALAGGIVELIDTGVYHKTYTSAPRMALYADWGDIYQGKDVSYNADGSLASFGLKVRNALYFHEQSQRLYWTFYDNYNTSAARRDWNLGFSTLDSKVGTVGASTAYGPFRTVAADATGTFYGGRRSVWLWQSPLDGSMLTGAPLESGISISPWGPNQFGGQWPGPTTPQGYQAGSGASDIALPDKYLMYYFTPIGTTGTTANLRSMRRLDAKQYIWDLDTAHGNAHEPTLDPAKNGGFGSWTSLDFFMGGIWLNLTHKKGVIFAAQLIGNSSQNPTDPNSAHVWYSNTGAGTYTCPHGFAPGTPGSGTGPATNANGSYPALLIYNPDDLIAVKNGTAMDYTRAAIETVDLRQKYGAQFSMETGWAPSNGISGFYFDRTRNYLFVQATGADTGKEHLIHVFHISDT